MCDGAGPHSFWLHTALDASAPNGTFQVITCLHMEPPAHMFHNQSMHSNLHTCRQQSTNRTLRLLLRGWRSSSAAGTSLLIDCLRQKLENLAKSAQCMSYMPCTAPWMTLHASRAPCHPFRRFQPRMQCIYLPPEIECSGLHSATEQRPRCMHHCAIHNWRYLCPLLSSRGD